MKKIIFTICCFLGVLCKSLYAQQKTRIIVLTDIENEPDDAESMVRFLLYSNMWDVEGLIATTSIHQKEKIAEWRIKEIVTAYGKVRNNLLLHEKGYPEESYLQNIIKRGLPSFGMNAVGQGRDSEGSDWIIHVVDKSDDRAVWITVWGGENCLAQALWKVSMTRTPDEVDKFISKLRVYTVSDQDDSGPWLRRMFPKLFYIVSPGSGGYGYHFSTWTGISGGYSQNVTGADSAIVSNKWLTANIRLNHGPLGKEYPSWKYIMEGDTPTFLYLVNNGLGDPEHPDYGSWGGRYEYYIPRMRKWFTEPETRAIWSNAEDEVKGTDGNYYYSDKATIWRWRQAFQNDFAARMDWCTQPFDRANHPPVAILSHPEKIQVKEGETINLSAKGSFDPDGDQLSFEWIYYAEPGTYGSNHPPVIQNGYLKNAFFIAPHVVKPETLHIILAITDHGTPALTRYRRTIITVFPK